MSTIEEKRVFGDREGAVAAYVASAIGLVRVRIAGDVVGEFGLIDRRPTRDVAAGVGRVAVATDEDVLVASVEAEGATSPPSDDAGAAEEGAFAETDFGPAVAVGFHDGDALAAAPDGRIARLQDGAWRALESAAALDVRAIDGDLVAAAEGVYRVHDGGLDHAGLSGVRDVSKAGVPLAATDDALYKLGNGWLELLEGAFEVVAADPASEQGRLERAHAVTGLHVYAHDGDAWFADARTDAPVTGVAYGETAYAVTERGTFLARRLEADGDRDANGGGAADEDAAGGKPDGANAGSGKPEGAEGWRARTLGVGDVAGVAIPVPPGGAE